MSQHETTLIDVHWYLDLFDTLGIRVWIDGGWGVDALLAEQTRPHEDLDIVIPEGDVPGSARHCWSATMSMFHVMTPDRGTS